MNIPEERLAQIQHRFAELEARLASGQLEGEAFVAASRDYSELEPVARAAQEVREMRAEIAQLAALFDIVDRPAIRAEKGARGETLCPPRPQKCAPAPLSLFC